jgi:SAM-dependent methyltransferase
MGWRVFEKQAPRYEGWYATLRGQKVDRAERALLDWLLALFPEARSVVDIGCGTGHFTQWFAQKLPLVIGLDRAPAMLAEFRNAFSEIPIIVGDAHHLPVHDRSVDVSAFVVTLEFLKDSPAALAEAIRIARRGVLLITLNPWSLGGLSRRMGSQSRGAILSQAKDFPLGSLKAMAAKAAGKRLRRILWRSTLFPNAFGRLCLPVPLGDVFGIALVLGP